MSEFSFVQNSANPQTLEQTLLVGTYEWGRLIEYQHKARIYGSKEVYYCEENQVELVGERDEIL